MVQRVSIDGLRWVLSLVILFEAVSCLVVSSGTHHLGLPYWVSPVVCGGEVVAVLLFVIPPVSRMGAFLLLFILAFAILVHVLHRQFDVGALVVYGMAAIVCMDSSGKVAHEA